MNRHFGLIGKLLQTEHFSRTCVLLVDVNMQKCLFCDMQIMDLLQRSKFFLVIAVLCRHSFHGGSGSRVAPDYKDHHWKSGQKYFA